MLRRLCETKKLVTIFLPNGAVSLLAGFQQRELALAFREKKVNHVTLASSNQEVRTLLPAPSRSAPCRLKRRGRPPSFHAQIGELRECQCDRRLKHAVGLRRWNPSDPLFL
jgi:hypothetical protein